MSARFDLCVARVLLREGGLVNHPRDPGGLTNYGISQRAYPALDIARLTRDDAIAIYRRDYWDACSAEYLRPPLDNYVFDAAVNHGVQRAIHLLQRSLGVSVDGIIGPETLGAIRRNDEAAALFMAYRAMEYASLGSFPVFGKGWLKRLFLVASER